MEFVQEKVKETTPVRATDDVRCYLPREDFCEPVYRDKTPRPVILPVQYSYEQMPPSAFRIFVYRCRGEDECAVRPVSAVVRRIDTCIKIIPGFAVRQRRALECAHRPAQIILCLARGERRDVVYAYCQMPEGARRRGKHFAAVIVCEYGCRPCCACPVSPKVELERLVPCYHLHCPHYYRAYCVPISGEFRFHESLGRFERVTQTAFRVLDYAITLFLAMHFPVVDTFELRCHGARSRLVADCQLYVIRVVQTTLDRCNA